MQQDVNLCDVKVQYARRNIGCVQLKQDQEVSMPFLPASGLGRGIILGTNLRTAACN